VAKVEESFSSQSRRPHPKSKTNAKDWGVAHVHSTCLAGTRPRVQILVRSNKEGRKGEGRKGKRTDTHTSRKDS
jgi:hypothetical protein